MSQQDLELEAFSKFIAALEPWLADVALVGGWAHRLYRLDPRARKLDYVPLTTLDGDVAVPPKLKKEESFGSACSRPGLKKSSWERIARRRRITTTEKEAGSTRSSWRRSKGANTTGTASGRLRRK